MELEPQYISWKMDLSTVNNNKRGDYSNSPMCLMGSPRSTGRLKAADDDGNDNDNNSIR